MLQFAKIAWATTDKKMKDFHFPIWNSLTYEDGNEESPILEKSHILTYSQSNCCSWKYFILQHSAYSIKHLGHTCYILKDIHLCHLLNWIYSSWMINSCRLYSIISNQKCCWFGTVKTSAHFYKIFFILINNYQVTDEILFLICILTYTSILQPCFPDFLIGGWDCKIQA